MSDDHFQENEAPPGRDPGRRMEQVPAGSRRIARPPETVLQSKRFLVAMLGFLGAMMIFLSVGFGVYSLFAPSRPKTDGQTLMEAFVGLNATLRSNNAKIHAELLLIVGDGDSSTQLMNKGVPEENDLALLLRKESRGINWDNELPVLRRYVSRKPWQIGFLEIKSLRPFLAFCDTKREAIRVMLDNPDVDMQLSYQLNLYGFSVNKKERDNLWGYVHLEEYELARALTGLSLQQIQNLDAPPEQAGPNLAQALDALKYILKAAEVASRQKELNLRFDAAYIRENALDTVQYLVRHPQFNLHDANRVRNMLDAQILDWPSDGLVFAGERTASVWVYEQVRRGRLMEVLAQQDLAVLQQLGPLVNVERSVTEHINADELYYLTRMSEIIFICQKDFFERIPLLERWENELASLRNDLDKLPILADSVLLRDVRTVMHHLAIDRARTEAWVLALAAATRLPSDHITVHPVTGQPYSVRVVTDPLVQNKSVISLKWLDSEEPITVPGYILQP